MQTVPRNTPRFLAASLCAMFIAAVMYWSAVISMMNLALAAEPNAIRTVTEVQTTGSAATQAVHVAPQHDGFGRFRLPIGLFFAACLAAAAGGGLLLTSAVAFANEYDPRKQTARGRLAPA